MLLFKDIKQNYPVYILDTQEFSLIQGKATQVSFPRLEMNQKTGKTEMVVESRIATSHGEHKVKFDLPYEQTANALMSAKGYSEYVKKHGYHFTDALAEHVSKMMENANDPDGYEGMIFCRWTADAIGKAISINWEKFV